MQFCGSAVRGCRDKALPCLYDFIRQGRHGAFKAPKGHISITVGETHGYVGATPRKKKRRRKPPPKKLP